MQRSDLQFLKDLQTELKTQEHDCQAAPRFWALEDFRWVVTEEGYHDRVSIVFTEDMESEPLYYFVEKVVNGEFDEKFTKEQIEDLELYRDIESYDDILQWIKENNDKECFLIYEKEETFIVPNTMFLTKAEAKRHIELNHYHYSPRVHTYAMTAWRAPKVERLLNILETFDWEKVSLNCSTE